MSRAMRMHNFHQRKRNSSSSGFILGGGRQRCFAAATCVVSLIALSLSGCTSSKSQSMADDEPLNKAATASATEAPKAEESSKKTSADATDAKGASQRTLVR